MLFPIALTTSRQSDLRHSFHLSRWSGGRYTPGSKTTLAHHGAVAANARGPAEIRTREEPEIHDATSCRPQHSADAVVPEIGPDDVSPFVNGLRFATGNAVVRRQSWQPPDDSILPHDWRRNARRPATRRQ